jgi:hypothetical protein
MLSLNVYSEVLTHLKLNQWEQIFDGNQKWRLYKTLVSEAFLNMFAGFLDIWIQLEGTESSRLELEFDGLSKYIFKILLWSAVSQS